MNPADLTSKRTILVVDDTPDNLALMARLLKDRYWVKVAASGARALEAVKGDEPPDLVLLDIMMPGMDGYEVCRRLKADPATEHIPVVFLTAMTADEDEQRGFEVGGADYITKPISPSLTLARVRTHLENKLAADLLRDQNAFLEREVMRRTREVEAVQDAIILALAMMGERRGAPNCNHILRRQQYVLSIGARLQADSRYRYVLTPRMLRSIVNSSALHNIGLVALPDRLRDAKGSLSAEDQEVYKTHTRIARDVLLKAASVAGAPTEFLDVAREIAYLHHEHWDGSGYPEGREGESIPLPARIMAVVNAYDDLVFGHGRGAPVTHEQAVAVIQAGAGTLFDPAVARALAAVEAEFRATSERYPD